jgi:hypothetical protein
VSLAMIPSIAKGTHQIGLMVEVSSSFRYAAINLVGIKAMAFISLFASGNSL